MMQSSIESWTRNHARGTIHPHPEGWGLLAPPFAILQVKSLFTLGDSLQNGTTDPLILL